MKLMDFSDDCRELSLVSLNKEIGYRMSMKMRKANVSDFQQQPTHPFDEGGISKSEQRLIEIISQDQPLMIARFGSVELGAFVNYLQVVGKLKDSENYSLIKYLKDECFPNWYSIATRTSLSRQAGFFPCTNEMLTNWGKMVLNDINDLDVLLTWLDSVEQTMNELAEVGIECEPIRVDDYTGKKMTFFHDPDGLPLELHE